MRITSLWFLIVLGGCSTSSTSDGGADGSNEDAGTPRDPNKNCVKPGTPNNELGVGGYCELKDDAGNFKSPADCKPFPDGDGGLLTSICTSVDPGTPADHWFCTRLCEKGQDAICGSTAYCDCQGGRCGCIPLVCGDPPDASPKDAASSTDAPSDAPADGG